MSMGDNSMYLGDSTALEIRADLARAADGLKKQAEGRQEWIDGMVSAATRIAAKRAELNNNEAFGAWWDEQGFDLGQNDRAALAAMGAEPETMRAVLADEPTRTSMQTIYADHKSRFTKQVSKTAKRKPRETTKPAKPRKPKRSRMDPTQKRPKEERAIEIIRARLAAGLSVDPRELEEMSGPKGDPNRISHETFQQAAAVVREVDAALAEQAEDEPPIDIETLSLSAKQKLEMAERRLEKIAKRSLAARQAQMDDEVHRRVMANTAERLAYLNTQIDEATAKHAYYLDLINNHEPIYTIEEWELLRLVTHSDNVASAAKRDQANVLIREKKFLLTGKK